ncbi:MAG: VWA domain-containing protein [Boseongicola sp. SB0676_bin_33]|nr:VWA domain-containing protein [Boseongicola sp. SB0676_bin_33]
MTESRPLPRAAEPFVRFSAVLRAHGFTVAPDQTIGFLQANALLGPRSVEDIRRAGVAVLAIPKDRQEEFDALFRAHFLGVTAPGAADAEDETVPAHEPTGASDERDKVDADAEAGEQAAAIERLSRREFAEEGSDAALARFQRLAPARLPRRRSYRFAPDQRGRLLDMRRTLRDAARRDGEVFTLARRRRKDRQRKIVLLIDVSGSMKDRTEAAMTFAHALTGAADRAEVFTLGTRLTRLTPAFRVRNRARALERASALVADVDGGTRIGEALTTFLAVPRYAGFARGAAIVVLSDGLERGSPALMSEAVRRLSKLAWRLDWLTPRAADPDYGPATGGLSAIVPSIDALADGSTSEVVAGHVLSLASRARQGSAA